MSEIKGQIIGGTFDEILVRQKNDSQIELGELLIAENDQQKVLFQTYDIGYGSQISQQNLELISGMYLEENQPIELYEENLRNYTVAKLKAVLTIPKNNQTKSTKELPNVFSTVREVKDSDLEFLKANGNCFSLGTLRSGSKKHDLNITLPTTDTLSHHILIAATTGKGKSNLMKVMLWDLLTQSKGANLILDPHDEYYGRNGIGLKDHPQWNKNGTYYTASKVPQGGFSLKIHISLLKPKHFQGVLDLSHPQMELMYAYYTAYREDWIENLLKKDTSKINFEFHDGTFGVVERRLSQLLDIYYNHTQEKLICKGIFDTQLGKTILSDIANQLENAQSVIVDTSSIAGTNEIFVSSILTNAIFDKYRHFQKKGILHTKPVVSIVLEEAPRVIGKEVLERGQNVFSTIAKEGRKFQIGLCAITQLPSLIPKPILANMNTKVILGIEMALERNAIIESAAQDLTTQSRAIASLDKGEAIITSNFARFATPIKIPLFADVVAQSKKEKPTVRLAGL